MSLKAQASEHLEWNTDILGVGALGNGDFLNESTKSRNIRRDRDSKNPVDGPNQTLKSSRGRVDDLSRSSRTSLSTTDHQGSGQRSQMAYSTSSTAPTSSSFRRALSVKSQGKLRDLSSNHSDVQSLASDDAFTVTDGKFDVKPGHTSGIDWAVPTPAPLQAPSGYGSTTVYAPKVLQEPASRPQPVAEPNLVGTRPASHTSPADEGNRASSLPRGELPKSSPQKVGSVLPPSSEAVLNTSKSIPVIYQPLVASLQQYRSKGFHQPLRSKFATDLIMQHPGLYQKAGVKKFSQYSALAHEAGMISLGGKDGLAWISLCPEWHNI
ncbi:hypothetical protein H0H93_013171 [Arthromyces matolae]|nr:hypothetical protein H0H93_013171 [Arthromyces matolae]